MSDIENMQDKGSSKSRTWLALLATIVDFILYMNKHHESDQLWLYKF